MFFAHSHLVHAGAPGRRRGGDDPLGFDVAAARVHFLVDRAGNQDESGAYPVAWRGEEQNEGTRVEAHDDGSTGASAVLRDAPAPVAATGDGPRDLSAYAGHAARHRQVCREATRCQRVEKGQGS